MSELLYQVALTMIPGVGDVLGKKLVAVCGSAESVFRESRRMVRKIPRIGESLLNAISSGEILQRAEQEVLFVQRYGIKTLFFTEKDYPFRLKNCIDAPVLLYYKGTADLNAARIIGMVGTRSATEYGKQICREILTGLTDLNPLIVSGLAYGIDSCAHRNSLELGLPTIGVLAHGLDRIYPYLNKDLAGRMVKAGGLLTDFTSGTKPDRENFPKRNRIIAGLCDAVIVVEAAMTGGALITADIAGSYNRDVFAIPGRIGDHFSEGTNHIIKTNKAALIQSAADIRYMMGWDSVTPSQVPRQGKIFLELTPDEEIIIEILRQAEKTGIDELAIKAGLSMSKVSCALLNLEFEGVVKCMPGKVYSLNH